MPCTWHILKHLKAVPILAPRPHAHIHPALGASQGRQLLLLHATERCLTAQTFRGISNNYLTIAFKTVFTNGVFTCFLLSERTYNFRTNLHMHISSKSSKTHPFCELVWTLCFVMFCVFLYGSFCHGAHKRDLFTLFLAWFLRASLLFISRNLFG